MSFLALKPLRRQGDLTGNHNCVHLILRPVPDHCILHTACAAVQPAAFLRASEDLRRSRHCVACDCEIAMQQVALSFCSVRQPQVHACRWSKIAQHNEKMEWMLFLKRLEPCNLKRTTKQAAATSHPRVVKGNGPACLLPGTIEHWRATINVSASQTCIACHAAYCTSVGEPKMKIIFWLDMISPFLQCLLS